MWRNLAFAFVVPAAMSACGGGGASGSGVGLPVAGTPPAPAAASCAVVSSNITQNTVLKSNCTYMNSFVIQKSDVTLDCNGSTIDGRGRSEEGITIDSAGRPLKNVTVQNCTLVNHAVNAIYVGWDIPASQKLPYYSHDQLYALTPQNITIRNTNVLNSTRNGIYLADYVTRAVLDNVRVENSGQVGLYMDSSTTLNTVKNSTFSNNGAQGGREGIAIDASAQNTISNNTFSGNALAAITLYKNCWEHHGTNPDSFPRWQHSNNNRIVNNTFQAEPVGVWIAARQSRDLSSWGCGDPTYHAGIYFLDYAQNNIVQGNSFDNVSVGVIVEDNNNQILGNDFTGVTGVGVEIGGQYRALYLNQPVVGTVIQGNKGNTGL